MAATSTGLAIAIETSSRLGSVALVDEGAIVADENFAHGLQHAAGLLPIIDRLIRDHGRMPAELRQVYVSAGPGSFTGLRIGITLVKTIAFAAPTVQLVAVPTTAVLAENAPADARHLIVLLDAKRGQIFTAGFDRNPGGSWTVREPAHLDTLSAMLERAPRPVHLLGEGIPFHPESIPASADVIITSEESWRPRAQVVARIGMAMAAAGEFADPQTLTPIYIRMPEAEEKWELANRR